MFVGCLLRLLSGPLAADLSDSQANGSRVWNLEFLVTADKKKSTPVRKPIFSKLLVIYFKHSRSAVPNGNTTCREPRFEGWHNH